VTPRPASVTRIPGALAAVAVACVGLAAGCGASGSTRHVAASSSSAVATTTSTGARGPTTTATIPSIAYRVKRGETLTTIARRFHVSIAAIVSGNHVTDPDHLAEGQTLRIPHAPPLVLVVTPPEGQAGQAFRLELTGAVPSETIKFEIDSAAGKYSGGPHTASADGVVRATYRTSLRGPVGTYTVIATGDMGTAARSTFAIVAAPTTSST